MPNPIIERAAQALATQDCLEQHGPDAGPPPGDAYVEQVRAVLAAIRQPTDEMLTAAAGVGDETDFPTAVWQAMIDAALER